MQLPGALRLAVAGCLILCTSAAAAPASNGRRPITETDLFRFVWVGRPADLARRQPRSRSCASRSTPRRTATTRRSGSCRADGSASPRALHGRAARLRAALVARRRSGWPSCAPPRRTASRSRRRSTCSSTQGGEARALTDLPRGAGAPAWSPDGRSAGVHERHERQGPREAGTRAAEEAPDARGSRERARERRARDHARDLPVQRPRLPRSRRARRTSGRWRCRREGAERAKPRQLTSGAVRRGRARPGRPTARAIYFTSNRVARAVLRAARLRPLRGHARGRRAGDGREHRRARSADLALQPGRPADRVPRHAQRAGRSAPTTSPTCSSPSSPARARPEPDRRATTSTSAAASPATSARRAAASRRPVWTAGRPPAPRLGRRRARAREPGARRRRDRRASTPLTRGDQEVVGLHAPPPTARAWRVVVSTPTVIGDLYRRSTPTGGTPRR